MWKSGIAVLYVSYSSFLSKLTVTLKVGIWTELKMKHSEVEYNWKVD